MEIHSQRCNCLESILNDSSFFGLKLDGLVMRKSSAKDVDFRLGSFEKTKLEYANFTDTTNTQINMQTNHLKGAIFNRDEALYLLESMGLVLV